MTRPYSPTSICVIILSGIITLCCSCRRVNNVVYSDFVSFDEEGWDPICVLPFYPSPIDSVKNTDDRFDLILTLRYSPGKATSEIPIEITEEDENGVMATKRLTIRLRDNNGKPRGRKSICLYEISDTLKRDFKLPEGYLVNITSLSPSSNTRGLYNVGLTLSTTGPGNYTFIH